MRLSKPRKVFAFAIICGVFLYVLLIIIQSIRSSNLYTSENSLAQTFVINDNLQVHVSIPIPSAATAPIASINNQTNDIKNNSFPPFSSSSLSLSPNQLPSSLPAATGENNIKNRLNKNNSHSTLQQQSSASTSSSMHNIPEFLRAIAAFWPMNYIATNPLYSINEQQQQKEANPSSQSLSSSTTTCTPDANNNLGPVFVPVTLQQLNASMLERYEKPRIGGIWYPSHCQSQQKVAILVPYRNREENLNLFTHHMHYFLQQQQLDYGLFVIEQLDTKRFNRAKLFNIGFLLSQMMHNYDCYVLHDVDKMPEDTRFLYHCNAQQPKQMPHLFRQALWDFHSVYRGKRRPKQRYYNAHLYTDFFGGVSALSKEQFLSINGMTNSYWGWGAEDDELLCRIRAKGYKPIFSKDPFAKYVIVEHKPDADYSHRGFPKCRDVAKSMATDGLNNLNFELNSIQLYPLYTLIRVIL